MECHVLVLITAQMIFSENLQWMICKHLWLMEKSYTTWDIYIYNLVNLGKTIPSLYQLVSRISSINIYDPYQQRQLGIRVWIPKDAHSRDTSEEPLATPGRPNGRDTSDLGDGETYPGRFFFCIVGSIPAPSKGCHMVPKGCQFTIPQGLIGEGTGLEKVFLQDDCFPKNSFEATVFFVAPTKLCHPHPFHRRQRTFFWCLYFAFITPTMGWVLPDGHPYGDFSETCKDYQRILKCLTVKPSTDMVPRKSPQGIPSGNMIIGILWNP